MPKQSSIQRKQAVSIQPSQTAPIQKYLIQVTAKAGTGWERIEVTKDAVLERVNEIVTHGYQQLTGINRLVVFPAASIEKIEVVRE